MKNFATTSAALVACISAVNADFCGIGSSEVDGNFYCQAVNAITYQNFGSSGSYQKVTNMDVANGACSSAPQSYSGSLAPLDGEVSLHYRGPINVKQFAFYAPGESTKRSVNDAHHAHMRFHGRRDNQKRQEITATINGDVVSWAVNAAAATDAPSSGSNGSSGDSDSSPLNLKAPYKPAAPKSAGAWTRHAYYNAESQTSEGMTLLNTKGSEFISGNWTSAWGNSLSYATSNGQDAASGPQILADTVLPSDTEVVFMSDKPCKGDSCGATFPGGVAYHGFDGRHKLFAFEFSMPSAASGGFNADMPAIWMLNAQIPRTVQYGNPDCSCWATGCGEFDLFEVLTPGENKMKSTLHGNVAGGDSDYFNRPLTGTMKAAVLMSESQAHIKLLNDDFDFHKDVPAAFINQLAESTDDQSSGVSLFSLS